MPLPRRSTTSSTVSTRPAPRPTSRAARSRSVIGVIGEREVIYSLDLEGLPGVAEVIRVLKPYKLVSREFQSEDTVVRVGSTQVGGDVLAVIAGPCSIESEAQMHAVASAVKDAGGTMLRGGAYKPRTSPYAFQGMGEEGLRCCGRPATRSGCRS